jgi:hypothetical protein
MSAQHYYVADGRRIEMIKALVNKFHPFHEWAIQTIILSMQNLELLDTEDLSIYRTKLENYNLQLSWVGQAIYTYVLLFLALSQLKKSRY